MSNRWKTAGEVNLLLALTVGAAWRVWTTGCHTRPGLCFHDPQLMAWATWTPAVLYGAGLLTLLAANVGYPKPPDGLKNPMFSRGYALVDGEDPTAVRTDVVAALRALGPVTPTTTGGTVGAGWLRAAVDVQVDAAARTVRATLVHPRWVLVVFRALVVAWVALLIATPWLQLPPVHPSPFPVTPRWLAAAQFAPLLLFNTGWIVDLHRIRAAAEVVQAARGRRA